MTDESDTTGRVAAVAKTTVKWLVILALLGALLGGAAVAGLFYYYGQDLPQIMTRKDFDPKEVTRIYSSDEKLIGEIHRPGGRRTVVPLQEIPNHVRWAFMAAEDASFMSHEGIDYLGMVRAFYYAIVHGERIKGTSTITQQVVKNLILVPDRTIRRKIREIILARELEQNLSKKDILYMYLNTIYLGHGNYGVEEAARFYFGKSAKELSLAEAATLATLPQSPERLSPKKHPSEAEDRRGYVLDQLLEKGFIEEAAYEEAKSKPIETVPLSETYPHRGTAEYYVRHVKEVLTEKYGKETVRTGGLRVYTSLDVDKQREAKRSARSGLHDYDARHNRYQPVRHLDGDDAIERFRDKIAASLPDGNLATDEPYRAVVTAVDEADVELALGRREAVLMMEPKERILRDGSMVSDVLERGDVLEVVPRERTPGEDGVFQVEFTPGPQSALVSIDPETRDVVALVGGYKFETDRFNHATQAKRQTGSTFKPFVYGAGLESKTITPASIYYDSPSPVRTPDGKKWSPKNADREWRGPIRVREGLGASRNVVAVRVLKDVGVETAQEFAHRLGVQSELVDNYTLTLGSSALTPLELVNAYATIASGGIYAEPRFVRRVETTAGDVDHFEYETERVLARDVAYVLTNLMTSVVEGYVDSAGTQRGGTAHSLSALRQHVAGKTGSTSNTRDAWFVGFTPQLTTGVWVGYDSGKTLGPKEFGGRVAGPIWLDYMKSVLGDRKPYEFERPETGVTTARIDPETGKLARDGGFEETFLTGTAPTSYAPSGDQETTESFLMNQFESDDSAESSESDDEDEGEETAPESDGSDLEATDEEPAAQEPETRQLERQSD